MADQTKQAELLPTTQSEVSLAELARAAQPLVDKWSETEIAKEQEETKRLHTCTWSWRRTSGSTLSTS